MEEKWIAFLDDNYGIKEYITSYDENGFKTNTYVHALLITNDEKKKINKVLKKNRRRNARFIRLSKFDMISYCALDSLREMNYDYSGVRDNPAQWLRREDPLSLECIRFAKEEDLSDMHTFKEFSKAAADSFQKKQKLNV